MNEIILVTVIIIFKVHLNLLKKCFPNCSVFRHYLKENMEYHSITEH